MKKIAFAVLALVFLSVSLNSEVYAQSGKPMNPEVVKMNETRDGFIAAIKEGRYGDLYQFMDPEMKAVGPGSADWQAMYELGASRGAFPYDSIRMVPQETVQLSETMGYDFGSSYVYYTDKDGKVVELRNTFLVLMRKQEDGTWRLFREVASSRLPGN